MNPMRLLSQFFLGIDRKVAGAGTKGGTGGKKVNKKAKKKKNKKASSHVKEC